MHIQTSGWYIGDIDTVELEILNPYNERFLIFYCGLDNTKITISKINNVALSNTIIHTVSDYEKDTFLFFDIERR